MFEHVLGRRAIERMTIFALNDHAVHLGLHHHADPVHAVRRARAQLKKEGEAGRKKINQYTRYGTVLLATAAGLRHRVGLGLAEGRSPTAVIEIRAYFRLTSTVVTLVGGTMFLMWLGEQITARGVGNGISLIIFAGIVAANAAARDCVPDPGASSRPHRDAVGAG